LQDGSLQDGNSALQKAVAGILSGVMMFALVLGAPSAADAQGFAGLFSRGPQTLQMQAILTQSPDCYQLAIAHPIEQQIHFGNVVTLRRLSRETLIFTDMPQ
jgi:hypothetical protein